MAGFHVIGAGLAGLASAVALAERGNAVAVYETAGQAGGRCRSFHDAALGGLIDNGNHLLMSANFAALAYLDNIGSVDGFWSPPAATYPFRDLRTGERWTVAPTRGPVPWWIFDARRRVAGTRATQYLEGLRLAFAGRHATVDDCLDRTSPLYERFWQPLAVAALNTAPAEGSARLLWRVVAATFLRGAAGCRPMIARHGLGPALIEPALATLARRGVAVHFNARLRRIDFTGDRAVRLHVIASGAGRDIDLTPDDKVILAVPPLAAAALLPELTVPDQSRAIVNAHFRVAHPLTPPGEVAFLGLVGGTADWLFQRGPIVSVTVSAGDVLADRDNAAIESALWRDTAAALDLTEADRLAGRIIKEKRATFAQTPAQAARRPGAATRWRNLALAGDWTDTGLPASIEGAIRSANAAVAALA